MQMNLDPISRLTKDLKTAAVTLSPKEARFIVDAYYTFQEYRKASGNQVRALTASGEPHDVIAWLFAQTEGLEKQILRALDAWTDASTTSVWAKGICGIGPVIAAGLLAHIDIRQAPTAGHIWNFAGLNPTQHWLGAEKSKRELAAAFAEDGSAEGAVPTMAAKLGCRPDTLIRWSTTDKDGEPVPMTRSRLEKACARRPWNAKLKVLCWKIGESFVKVQNNANDYYGRFYRERKALEIGRNDRGEFAEQAAQKLADSRIGKDTEAYGWYSQGKLPPAHIHARVCRWTVKLFLSHWHEKRYWEEYGVAPPIPYAIGILGHASESFIPAP